MRYLNEDGLDRAFLLRLRAFISDMEQCAICHGCDTERYTRECNGIRCEEREAYDLLRLIELDLDVLLREEQ